MISLMHALTVNVEEAGGKSRVGATATRTTIVLIEFRCLCANALVELKHGSAHLWAHLPALANSYKKSQAWIAFPNKYLIFVC